MSTTRDFIASTLADFLLPLLRNSTEDAVYETLDKRQVPTRTDFKEIRDLVNSLRGQVSGTTNGIGRIVARIDELEAKIVALEERNEELASMEPRFEPMLEKPVPWTKDSFGPFRSMQLNHMTKMVKNMWVLC